MIEILTNERDYFENKVKILKDEVYEGKTIIDEQFYETERIKNQENSNKVSVCYCDYLDYI